MGIVINGEPRAYPHNIGWWNEIVNDRIGDQSVVVSLCPLTGTGQVFNATDSDGSQIEFGVSGLLINSNLVMYDRRDGETLYPQMIYTAINGDSGRRSPRADARSGDDLGTVAADVPKHHRGTSHHWLGVLQLATSLQRRPIHFLSLRRLPHQPRVPDFPADDQRTAHSTIALRPKT